MELLGFVWVTLQRYPLVIFLDVDLVVIAHCHMLLTLPPYVPISIETLCPNRLVYRAKGAIYGNERSQTG
jgi:hypothetical protein